MTSQLWYKRKMNVIEFLSCQKIMSNIRKVEVGCSLSHGTDLHPTSPTQLSTSKDSLKEELKQESKDICIGKSSLILEDSRDLVMSGKSLETITASQPVRKRQRIMSGKKKQEFKAPNLNLEIDRSREILLQIGPLSLNPLSLETSIQYPQTFTYVIMGTLKELLWKTQNLLELKNCVTCIGERPEPEKAEELGQRPPLKLILKTPIPNSGMVIVDKKMWSSMSSVELLGFHTYSDGWTDIRFWWK